MITFGRWQDGERFYIEAVFGPSETVDTTIVVSYKDEDGTALHAALNVTQVSGDSVIGWIPVPAEVDSLTVGSGADGASYDISDFNEFSPALDYALDNYNYNSFDDLMSNDGLAGLDGIDAGVEDQVMDSGIESGLEPFAAQWLEPLTTQYGDVDGWDKTKSETYLDYRNKRVLVDQEQQYAVNKVTSLISTGVAIDRDEEVGLSIDNQLSSIYNVDSVGQVLSNEDKKAMLDKPDLSAAFQVFLSEDKKNQLVYLTDGVSAVFEEYPVASTITVSTEGGKYFNSLELTPSTFPLKYKDVLVGSYDKVTGHGIYSESGLISTGHSLPHDDMTYTSSVVTDSIIDAPKSALTSLSRVAKFKSVISGTVRSGGATVNIGSMIAFNNGQKKTGTVTLTGGTPVVFLWNNPSDSIVEDILSALDVLETPIPYYADFPDNFTITNENFTAPNGVFDPIGSVAAYPTFHNSTFTVAPRIFSSLDDQMTYPGVNNRYNGVNNWTPFEDCKNIERVENQGTLGKNCVMLFSSYLPDFAAYPTFSEDCAPVVVDGWVAGPSNLHPLNITAADVANLPPFPTSKVTYWKTPYNVNIELTSLEFADIVFPSRPNDAPLIHYYDRLPELTTTDTRKSYIYGWRAFGTALPTTVTDAAFPVATTNLKGITEPLPTCAILSKTDIHTVVDGTFDSGKERVFDILNDDRNDLLAPTCHEGVKVVRDYYSRVSGQVGYETYGERPNENTRDHLLNVQQMPNTVEEVHGYMCNLYEATVFYSSSTGVFPPISTSVRILNDYLTETFKDARLRSSTIATPPINAPVVESDNFLVGTFYGVGVDSLMDIRIYGLPTTITSSKNYMTSTFKNAFSFEDDEYHVNARDVHIRALHNVGTSSAEIHHERGAIAIDGRSFRAFDPATPYDKKGLIPTGVVTMSQEPLTGSSSFWMKDTYLNAAFDPRESITLLAPAPSGDAANPFLGTLSMNGGMLNYFHEFDTFMRDPYTDIRAAFIPGPETREFFNKVFVEHINLNFDFRGGKPFYKEMSVGNVDVFNNAHNATIDPLITSTDDFSKFNDHDFMVDNFTYIRPIPYDSDLDSYSSNYSYPPRDNEFIEDMKHHPEQWRFSYRLPLT